MAELKTKKTTASVRAFLAKVAHDERRADCKRVAAMMKKVTKKSPAMWGASMVGFGIYRYTYASGQSGDWPVAAFAPRKNDLTLYLMPEFEEKEALLKQLGPHRSGKSCLYLKRLSDVDTEVLEKLIVASVRAVKKTWPTF